MCLIKHHALKTYRGAEVELHVFLTQALNGQGHLTAQDSLHQRKSYRYLMEMRVGSRAALVVVMRKNPAIYNPP
jgi:hypothetical protein